jgi:molybdopterin converting factor small subunit
VTVKLYATLREGGGGGVELGQAFPIDLEVHTVRELISQLGIRDDQAKIVMVNGIRIDDLSHVLKDNDMIVIFPPIGGG